MGKVCSALAWERGSVGVSPLTVTLQQFVLEGKQLVLALVCEGEEEEKYPQLAAGYLCESMVGWFYREFLDYCGALDKVEPEMLKSTVHEQWDKCMAEWKTYGAKNRYKGEVRVSGILLWDRYFVAWGNRPVYVMNRRFHKPRRKNVLASGGEMSFASGEIQGFVRFYLENQVMADVIEEEEVLDSLYSDKLWEEQKLEKRLLELTKAGKERSWGRSVGAVMLEVMP